MVQLFWRQLVRSLHLTPMTLIKVLFWMVCNMIQQVSSVSTPVPTWFCWYVWYYSLHIGAFRCETLGQSGSTITICSSSKANRTFVKQILVISRKGSDFSCWWTQLQTDRVPEYQTSEKWFSLLNFHHQSMSVNGSVVSLWSVKRRESFGLW